MYKNLVMYKAVLFRNNLQKFLLELVWFSVGKKN